MFSARRNGSWALGSTQLEFFREHRTGLDINLENAVDHRVSIVELVEFYPPPPPLADRKAEAGKDGWRGRWVWMDGSIDRDRLEGRRRTHGCRGRGEVGAVGSIYNWISAVVIRGEC